MLKYLENYNSMELEKRLIDQYSNEYIYTYKNPLEKIQFRFNYKESVFKIIHFIVYPRGRGLGSSFICFFLEGFPPKIDIILKPKNLRAKKFWLDRGFSLINEDVMIYRR
ncbi:hypothetical protein [Desulfosporosinus sp. FKB]|uniref:hypothetical protein n=1 Tax=Desulfosporosinus sp. FKB TaxID=1969835 RepID=UPI000B49D61E|nr:hypothetical protein [Desulfosporosinus sp. FKB]